MIKQVRKKKGRKQAQKFAEDGNSHLNVNKIINPGKERPEDKEDWMPVIVMSKSHVLRIHGSSGYKRIHLNKQQ